MDRVQEEETRGSQSSSVLGWFGKKEEPEDVQPEESGLLSRIFTSDKKKEERTKRLGEN